MANRKLSPHTLRYFGAVGAALLVVSSIPALASAQKTASQYQEPSPISLFAPGKASRILVTNTPPNTSTPPKAPKVVVSGDTPISLQEAEKIALREVPGGRVLSIERDAEWGHAIYEVEMSDASGWELELSIDAHSGKVLSKKHDD